MLGLWNVLFPGRFGSYMAAGSAPKEFRTGQKIRAMLHSHDPEISPIINSLSENIGKSIRETLGNRGGVAWDGNFKSIVDMMGDNFQMGSKWESNSNGN
jgi:hypothetical protein